MSFIVVTFAIVLAHFLYLFLSRLFLSPLAKIPGPKLAAFTSWYEFYYDVIKPGKFVWHIQDLHIKYGPIVRIGPKEIHINDPKFLDEIYPPASRKREKYSFFLRAFKFSEATGATISHDFHRRRREALNPFFSKKSVMAFESLIQQKVAKFQDLLNHHAEHQTPINLSDAYYGFAHDVVSNFCFGHDSNLLENENQAAIQRSNVMELLLGIKLNQNLPWIFDLLDSIPFPVAKHIMPAGLLDMAALIQDVHRDIQKVIDDKDNALRGSNRSIFYELRDNQELPPSEKTIERLEHEGTLLVMAGTDSPAKSLAITHFYLLQHPEILAKVRAEVLKVPYTATWSDLQQLPYLNGCIAEGNRLSFGVTARASRIAPMETLQYEQYKIPPGTPVSQTTLSTHTNEEIFPDPWSFRPERWFGAEGTERRKYAMTFNKGGRSCIGINLAYAELFLMVAAVVRYDMQLFETDESDAKFQHDFHVAFPKLGSKGIQALVKGKIM